MRKPLLALLAAVLLAGCTWSQFRGDAAHTGFQPIESKIGSSTVASLSEAWTAATGAQTTSPVVADGKVYIGFDNNSVSHGGGVMVFDAAGRTNCSGTPKVCHPLWGVDKFMGVGATPVVVNGILYVIEHLGNLEAYDAAGPPHCSSLGSPVCSPLWTADTFPSEDSPTVSGGVLYIGAHDELAAYDAAGMKNCSATQFGPRSCDPMWTGTTDGPIGIVSVAGGVAYAISANGNLNAFDAAGHTNCLGTPTVCAPLWTAAPPSGSTTFLGAVPVGGGRVYTMDTSRLLRAFDATGTTNCSGSPKTCSPLWTAQVPPATGNAYPADPALAYGRVYVGTAVYDAGGVTNCSGTPTVCEPLWNTSGTGIEPIVANGIEVSGGAAPIYGNQPLPLNVFDANGISQCSGTTKVCAPLKTIDPGGFIASSPAIANGTIYVATSPTAVPLIPETLHAYTPG